MRKLIAMLLALLLAASLPAVGLAEGPIGSILGPDGAAIGDAPIGDADDTSQFKPLVCEELGFSTLTVPSLDGYYAEGGYYIDLGNDDDSPWVMIAYAEGGTRDVDSIVYYFTNVYGPQMRDELGSDLIEEGPVTDYTVAGIPMIGAMYTYRINGRERVDLCLFETRDDGFVNYEARYYADDAGDCQAVLCLAAHYFQPDPYYYTSGAPAATPEPQPEPTEAPVPPVNEPEPQEQPTTYEGKNIVSCPEQGFSTLTSTQVGAKFVEGDGMYIYTEEYGYIPYAQLYVMADPPSDLHAYFDNTFTPYMQQQYGGDLIAIQELGDTTLGGRPVVAAKYAYRLQGYVIEMLRAYDNRDGRTLIYTAKYFQGEGDATLAALEEAVANYQPDADYYYNASGAPATVDGGSGDSLPDGGDLLPPPEDGQTQQPDLTGKAVRACPEMGFATACDPAIQGTYVEGDGLYMNSAGDTGIPYVLVYRSGDVLGEPFEYIKEQWTPHMQESYGEDLVGFVEYETYDIGGKHLPAGLYMYRLQGTIVCALRLFESTPQGTVSYIAKYVQGEDAETLAALDDIVRYMQQDANYYN